MNSDTLDIYMALLFCGREKLCSCILLHLFLKDIRELLHVVFFKHRPKI
jgi:hypothetical protein